MQLSSQSIHRLCVETPRRGVEDWLRHPTTGRPMPMIAPFLAQKTIINGKSAGLSSASYDLRIAHDLVLEPSPGYLLLTALEHVSVARPDAALALLKRHHEAKSYASAFAIAHTIENFALPLNVSAQVCDKSTYARMGVSCFNTFFDPGFIGNATLEIVNLSSKTIVIRSGDPICQLIFNWLDEPTDWAYAGKYQFQPALPVEAILEDAPAE
jgi:dCTP deaminase